MKYGFVLGVLISLTCGIGVSASDAGEVLYDNSGHIMTNPYGDSGLPPFLDECDYYDCYIPYKKTLEQIGGYCVDAAGIELTVEDAGREAVADNYRFLPSDLVYSRVGDTVGVVDESSIKYKSSTKDELGMPVFVDEAGNEYYGIKATKFLYNDEGVSEDWSYDRVGQLVDVILTSGEVVHCVICDLEWASLTNGWTVESDLEDIGAQREMNYYQYSSLFSDSEGWVLSMVGSEEDVSRFCDRAGLSPSNEESDNHISYIRVYSERIDTNLEERVNTDVWDSYGANIVFEESYDEGSASGVGSVPSVYSSLGMDNDETQIPLQFSDETQKIVEEHCCDFDASNFEEYMEECGGYDEYLKSLGGIFAEYAGDDVKIPVETAGDFKIASEYVYGIIAIWGFDYSNGRAGHYGRWMSGDGVSEGNVPENAFYPKNSSIPYRTGKYGTPQRIDVKASQDPEKVKNPGVNTCCNFTVDMLINKFDLPNMLTKSDGSRIGTCSIITQRKRMEEEYGFNAITKAEDLEVGDMVHCYTHALSNYEKTTADARISGWNHVFLIGEKDEGAGTLTLYNTGHDLTNDGNYKDVIKIKDGLPYAGWLATRFLGIEQSESSSLGDFPDGSSSGNSSGGGERIPDEEDLVGLGEIKSHLNDDALEVNLPDAGSLGASERRSVGLIRDSLEESLTDKVIRTVRVGVVAVGLLMVLYAVLMLLCYCFDSVGLLGSQSLGVLTLGRLRYYEVDYGGKTCFRRVLTYCIILVVVGMFLVSGGVYLWIQRIFNFFLDLF